MQGFITSAGAAQIRGTRLRDRQAICGHPLRADRGLPQRGLRRARPACPTATAAVTGQVAGKISVMGDATEIAVGDTITVEYTPAVGSPFLAPERSRTLLWTGGFNGWRGDTGLDETVNAAAQTLNFPFTPLLNGSFRVSIVIPDFAKSIDFAVTDQSGFAWDDNAGKCYSIPVKYRKRLDKKGEVEEYVAEEGEEVMRDLSAEQAVSPVMIKEEEERLHQIRGEANLVGEEKGLGNILINEARDMFEKFDEGRMGLIPRAKVGEALEMMSFELAEGELDALLEKYVKEGNEQCSMVEWMLIYSELELSDHGLDLV